MYTAWVSSTGADSQPFFRIFSIARQTERFDPDCEYIKKWVPELKNVEPKDIINWDTAYKKYPNVKYPKPMVDYTKSKAKTLKMYKDALYGK